MYDITIIIPVYNAEEYLEELLQSIVNQSKDLKTIEVIMVDDNSTDNSINIIKKYVKQYENFKMIHLSQNHSIGGTARNEGLKIAQGKYVMFADADDFYCNNTCEIMYNAIESKNADFVIGNYINTDRDGILWGKPVFNIEKYKDFKLSITDYTKSFFVLNGAVWNKIFRKDFVQKNQIKFLEGVPAEDAYFVTTCFMKSNKVYYIKDIIYCYRQRTSGNKSVSFSCSKIYFDRINEAYKAIYENFKKNNQIKFYRYMYAKNMSYQLYKFIDSKVLKKKERIQILKDMKWFYELSKELKVPACQEAQQLIINEIIEEDYEQAINYCEIVADIRKILPKEIREDMSRPDAKLYKKISKYNDEY